MDVARWLFGGCLAALVACGDETGARAPTDKGASGGTFEESDAGDDGGVNDECASETRDVYVVTAERDLYRFHPPDASFTKKGTFTCATTARPTSMAIDRRGVAWVRMEDGTLWKVDTFTLACEATGFHLPEGSFFKFGMGFATASAADTSETLYLADSAGAGLARLDTTKLSLSLLGPFTGPLAGNAAELTGTGDGRLFGFFVMRSNAGTRIAEIAKASGEVLTIHELPDLVPGDAWAFSFYGGDFYIYTTDPSSAQRGSMVTRFRPADGSSTLIDRNVGFTIVGAGVSTCAPTSLVR